MPEYRVYLETGASTVIKVNAESEDEAVDLAYDQLPSLCAQCSGWGQRAGVEIGDFEVESVESLEE